MITKISELEKYISAARGKPYYDYLVALGNTEDIRNKEAYRLYLWNIQISSAFLEVIALYEIALRNAIISALEANYKAYSILNDNFNCVIYFLSQSKNEISIIIKLHSLAPLSILI
ncbi:hypothetical protein [Aggregatibacter actinomycetemcomitans]|uniref:hypothetical protein n=1 Tax=Aggregatibacter actinomycetemcomitans TaxID=714 RepID=UPI002150C710|nr:hypothetical protein [Aggregatibacter actinomycetemcomitans]